MFTMPSIHSCRKPWVFRWCTWCAYLKLLVDTLEHAHKYLISLRSDMNCSFPLRSTYHPLINFRFCWLRPIWHTLDSVLTHSLYNMASTDRGTAMIAVSVLLVSLAAVSVLLRFAARRKKHLDFQIDDWLSLAGQVSCQDLRPWWMQTDDHSEDSIVWYAHREYHLGGHRWCRKALEWNFTGREGQLLQGRSTHHPERFHLLTGDRSSSPVKSSMS